MNVQQTPPTPIGPGRVRSPYAPALKQSSAPTIADSVQLLQQPGGGAVLANERAIHPKWHKTAVGVTLALAGVGMLAGCSPSHPPPQPPCATSKTTSCAAAAQSSRVSDEEALKALQNLQNQGIYRHFLGFDQKLPSATDALQRLDKGETIYVQSGKQQLDIHNRADLQLLDHLQDQSLHIDSQNSPISDLQKGSLNFLLNGKLSGDGLFTPGKNPQRLDAYSAARNLRDGKEVTVQVSAMKLSAHSLNNLVEIDSLYGRRTNHILPQEQFDSLKYFEERGDATFSDGSNKRVSAYDVLQLWHQSKPAYLTVGSRTETVRAPQQIQDLDALSGRGHNNILPQAQYDALQALDSVGQFEGGSAYTGLQNLRSGNGTAFYFNGGDYSETLSVNVAKLDDLAKTRKLVDNTREYDRYRLPFATVHQKLLATSANLPELAHDASQRSQSDYDRADSLPQEVDESYSTTETQYTYHYGYNMMNGQFEYHYGPETVTVTKTRSVHNYERDGQLSSANDEVNASRSVERRLPAIQARIESLKEGDNTQDLQNDLERLRTLASATPSSSLTGEIDRLQALLHTQNRPPRPTGWVVPAPRLGN